MKELLEMTAAEQAQAIRTGAVGVEELTTFYINRIEKYGMSDGLNAVSQLRVDALKRARRSDSQKPGDGQYLYGLPVLVKDNIDVAGLCTTAGSMALNDNLVLNVADRELVGEEQMSLYEGLLGRLEQGGAKICHVNQPRSSCLKTIMRCEFKRDLEEYLKCSSAKLKTLEDIIACYEANPERKMDIERINEYRDKIFSQKVLNQHGCFVADGKPYEVEIVSEFEAVIRGEPMGSTEEMEELIDEFRFYTPFDLQLLSHEEYAKRWDAYCDDFFAKRKKCSLGRAD